MAPDKERFVAKLSDVVGSRQSGMVVVVENPLRLVNAGNLVRTCDGLAVPEIHFVQEKHRFNVTSKLMDANSASASNYVLTQNWESTKACIEALRAKGFSSIASVLPKPGSSDQDIVRLPARDDDAARRALGGLERVALWMGSESEGLSQEAQDLCDYFVTIPLVGGVQSLNLAASGAILISELYRLRNTAQVGPPPLLTPDAATELTTALMAQHELPFRRNTFNESKTVLPSHLLHRVGDELVQAGIVREASGELVSKAFDLLRHRISYPTEAGGALKNFLDYPLNETLASEERKLWVDDVSIIETAKLLLNISKHYNFDNLGKEPRTLKLIAKSIADARGISSDDKMLWRPIRICLMGRVEGPPMAKFFAMMHSDDGNLIYDHMTLKERVDSLSFLIS